MDHLPPEELEKLLVLSNDDDVDLDLDDMDMDIDMNYFEQDQLPIAILGDGDGDGDDDDETVATVVDENDLRPTDEGQRVLQRPNDIVRRRGAQNAHERINQMYQRRCGRVHQRYKDATPQGKKKIRDKLVYWVLHRLGARFLIPIPRDDQWFHVMSLEKMREIVAQNIREVNPRHLPAEAVTAAAAVVYARDVSEIRNGDDDDDDDDDDGNSNIIISAKVTTCLAPDMYFYPLFTNPEWATANPFISVPCLCHECYSI